jgi:GDP-4-dehydro-6-deoxy-D-mannose reductase
MVSAYLLASVKGISGQVYNLGSGVGVSVCDLIAKFELISGIKVEVKVQENMLRVADVPILVCDASKFKALSGWSPKISLETTLTNVYNYWKEQV